jgi:hypothetical protein
MMTERAKRAADELKKRGWSIDGELNKKCHECGYGLAGGIRYCPQCGTKCTVRHDCDTLADLEAAIAAICGTSTVVPSAEIAHDAWKLRMCYYDEAGEMVASREPEDEELAAEACTSLTTAT